MLPHTKTSDSARSALVLAGVFALAKFLILMGLDIRQAHLGWGYFRDEMYYIMCGRHLAFGYVDQGPIVALQARAAVLLFGRSLAGIRAFSAMAGAFTVGISGILCWRFGGGRGAQALCMLAVLFCPQYMGTDSYLSMNSFEAPFWALCVLAVVMLVRGGSWRWWLLFGAAGGIGIENKPSMAFFLAALLVGLLATPARRILATRGCAAGVALLLALAAPFAIWQMTHHWPTWEFLHNGRVENKNVRLAPVAFFLQQILTMGPLTAWLWLTGVVIALRRAPVRWLGITYIAFLALMMALHAKDYYVTPIYPALIALGCAAAWNVSWRSPRAFDRWRLPVFAALIVAGGLFALPAAVPVFRVEMQIAYLDRTHLHIKSTENTTEGPLPQFFADRFGWQEEADSVKRIYNSLSLADKADCGIFGSNYGETSALYWLLPTGSIPDAVSGQNAYWMWGPHGYTGDCMIEVVDATPADMAEIYQQVEIVGRMDNPYSMPYEHRNIYLVHHRKEKPFAAAWAEMKHYI